MRQFHSCLSDSTGFIVAAFNTLLTPSASLSKGTPMYPSNMTACFSVVPYPTKLVFQLNTCVSFHVQHREWKKPWYPVRVLAIE